MKRYESYKDSGVKWLGEIPGHWEVYKLKYLFRLNKIKNVGNKCNTILSLSYGKIIIKKDLNEGLTPESYESYQLLNKGDIVIRSTDLQNDHTSLRTGLVKSDGAITSAYIGLKNLNVNLYDSRYYHYFLHDWDITKAIYNEGKGLRQSLNWDDIKNMLLPVLDINEQTAIANYLDSVTSKIDEAISQQQKMIDLLNERKQIIIQNAVTKGLDPNAKMKDSGVEWIGEIPEDWEVRRLRNYLRIFSEKGYSHCQLLSVTREMGVILRDKENIEENHNFVPDDLSGYKHINKGDFVINKMKSWQGSYGLSDYEGIVSPAYFTCKLSGIDKKYFSTAIRSKAYIGFFNRYSKGIRLGQWDLDPLSMKEIPFIEPPLIDQQKIYNYLSEINKVINIEIEKCNKMISLLQERKQIIINDVVTGKVKVI